MKGRKTVKQEKINQVKDVSRMINDYKTIAIANLYKIPAAQYQKIKMLLSDKAIFKVIKKNILIRALQATEKDALISYIPQYPVVLFSNESPFKLYRIIKKNKAQAAAKPGDVATSDIIIPAGPTDIMPGPAMTTLKAAGLDIKVEGGKITILKDKVVCKKGDVITQSLASIFQQLKMEPMEIFLNVVVAHEAGMIYTSDVLNVDETFIYNSIQNARMYAVSLSLKLVWPTSETIGIMIADAFRKAQALGIEAGVPEKEILPYLISKAECQARILSDMAKI